jgi:hypothetical protein
MESRSAESNRFFMAKAYATAGLVMTPLWGAPVDRDEQRRFEVKVAHQSGLRRGGSGAQPFPVHVSVPDSGFTVKYPTFPAARFWKKWLPCEGVHLEVGEARLDDRPRPGDLVPRDRDPEERIGGAPRPTPIRRYGRRSARSRAFELADRLGDLTRARPVEPPRVHDDDVRTSSIVPWPSALALSQRTRAPSTGSSSGSTGSRTAPAGRSCRNPNSGSADGGK